MAALTTTDIANILTDIQYAVKQAKVGGDSLLQLGSPKT